MIIIYLGGLLLFSSCNRIESDSTQLCNVFYQLNKHKNFDSLLDVAIGGGRVMSIYDPKTNKYDLLFKTIGVYNEDTKGYVDIPIFFKDANLSEIDSIFNTSDQQTKQFLARKLRIKSGQDLFNSYRRYIGNILRQYYEIETPKEYSSTNVVTEGNPSLGNFITFTLNESCKCYYLADPKILNEYWSNHFKSINKLDPNWYFEITNLKMEK